MTEVPESVAARPRWTRADVARLAIVEVLQLAPLALMVVVGSETAAWTAAVIGSCICCAGTDSGWRWRNRLLVVQAVVWLVIPTVFV